VSNHYLIQQK